MAGDRIREYLWERSSTRTVPGVLMIRKAKELPSEHARMQTVFGFNKNVLTSTKG